ncbi:hypothetical protein GCM10010400_57130 [Streptomyces aculeolatus]|uniref:RHS repeat-associated core domain-containing protein n=1 Tax=Streptomyces aculeolatus TaxID=270689 RepID=UPI001CEC7AFC|nr:RHS repeat-associated core domain-containing protein [Streptomyces aculeolatus]
MGNRPTDWHVLDLDDDPTPGDPERVKQLARELHDFADDVADALRQIKGMAGEDALLRWAGKTAKAFQDEFEEVPKNLKKLQRSYDLAGDALAAYWPKLERAQSLADKALARGREAQSDLTAANGRLDSANSWVDRATKKTEEYDEKEGKEKPDESEVRAATRNATDAKSARASAQTAVDNAQGGLEAAKKMAADAKKMREDAASEAKDKLEDASDAGIQNRKWWEKAVDWVKDNWDTIVTVCKVIVAVLGIVVLIIGGPLAWVVLAAALVVLADTLVKYMNGEASLWDVAFAALDCIPGMKGLTTLGGLAKGLKGGLSALKGLKSMKSAVLGLAKRGGDMLANGAKGAYNRLKNVVRGCGDPVDMATGKMFLTQTDVELPGALPLVFTRRAESGYLAGRWFGPAWTSTADQRVEAEDDGVVFVSEDGLLLKYPHPAGTDDDVMPEEGPRWPLRRLENGGYLVTDPGTGHTRRFAPPADHDVLGPGVARIEQVSDRDGHTLDFDYGEDGAPAGIRHSGGYHLKITTAGDRITALAVARAADDGSGVTVKSFAYDEDGNLTEDVNSSGLPLVFTYDERLRITSWTDRNSRRYTYTYDEHDRCIAQRGESGVLALVLAYDGADPAWPGARVTTLTTPEGAATRFVINENSEVVAEIDAVGAVSRTEYDAHHHVVSETDALGHTTRYTNDPGGRPTLVVHPDGTESELAYSALGRLTSLRLTDGAAWFWEYDAQGRCTSVTDPAGAVTRYEYDEFGHLAGITDPLGQSTSVKCDAAGLPLTIATSTGRRIVRRHDAFGRVREVADQHGAVTRLRWTVEGRLAGRIGPDGAREAWEYDGEGNCTGHRDAQGGTTRYEYTHFDLLAARSNPDGATYRYSYDPLLRLTAVADPEGREWTYEYDPAGNLTAETDFHGVRIAYGHDAAGRMSSRTNPLGQTVEFERDWTGQIVAKRVDGAATTFEHDPLGRLLRATAPGCDLRRTHDVLGRLTAETVNGRTLTLAHDAVGRPTERVTPGGRRTRYGYDETGQRTAVDFAGHAIRSAFDAAGRETTRSLDDALLLDNAWDAAGRLGEQRVRTPADDVLRRRYDYRADGHLVHVEDGDRGSRRFRLDPVGRVTGVEAAGWREEYAYDAAGNQTRASWPEQGDPDAQGARELDGGRLVGAGRIRYTYDAAGRVTVRTRSRLSRKPEVWRYEWDAEDRITAVTTPDGTVWRYLYDPFGRRLAKRRMAPDGSGIAEEILFTWDENTLVEQTTVTAGGPHQTTLTWEYDGLQPVAQAERLTDAATQEEIDSRFFAIVTDLVGAPTELVDPRGEIAWQARRTVWGHTRWPAGSAGYTPLRFPGQYFDPETGLHYNCQRYYDPDTARYASPDPLGLTPAPNPYTYVHNPHTWFDPLGLTPCFIGPLDHVALGRSTRGGLQVQDFAEVVQARHFMDPAFAATWQDEVVNAIARVGRGEGRISFMLDGLPAAGGGPARALNRALTDAGGLHLADDAFANGRIFATQWELIQVHKAGLMDKVDFYRWNRKFDEWRPVT